jgi:hypothetical protein
MGSSLRQSRSKLDMMFGSATNTGIVGQQDDQNITEERPGEGEMMSVDSYLVALDMPSFADDAVMEVSDRIGREKPYSLASGTYQPVVARRPRPRDLRFGRGPDALVIDFKATDRPHAR